MLSRIDFILGKVEEYFIATLLLVASILLFANVVGRYVFGTSVLGAEELVRYMIVWMVFVGGSVAARKGIHIGVDAFLKFSGARVARIISIVVLLICICFTVTLFYYGLWHTMDVYQFGQRSSALRLPYWIAQAAIPVGAGLMAIRFTQRLVALLRARQDRSELEMIG